MLQARYEINAPDVVSEAFDGECVVLNLSNGRYYSMIDSANLLWTSLADGTSPQAIIERATMAGNVHAAAIESFLEKVIELQLVRLASSAEPLMMDAALAERVANIDTAPLVEVFDDLADLILADPVHDVDEGAGWPVQKAT
jgi:hypothetical protein